MTQTDPDILTVVVEGEIAHPPEKIVARPDRPVACFPQEAMSLVEKARKV